MAPSSGDISPSDPSPTDTPARSTIAERAEAWRELLTQSSDLLHGYKDGGAEWARLRDLAGRFNLWASNMGVFAAVHGSLDYRLRDLVDVKELILEQLDYMVEGLDRLITVLNGLETFLNAATDTDYESASKPAGLEEVDTVLSSLSTSIDWLHRLANMIRRASFLRQNARASNFPLKDSLGSDLTPVLKKVFHHWIKRDFPTISDDLCERLVSTMLLRRRRVLYRRSRQAKFALHTAKPVPKPAKQTLSAPSAVSGLSMPEDIPREGPAPSGVASTQHTVTTLEPERLRHMVSTPSRVSEAHTIPMTTSDKNIIPLPPRLAPNDLEFVCPFCCLILPASNARNRDLWRAHVKKDLDPYVCAFFPCAQGEDILSTSADWISHEETHCMRWYCTSKTHSTEIFETQEEYINHMKAKHPGKFKEAQLPLLAENSRRPLKRIFDACPLCGEESEKKGHVLEDHVAHHFQYLALLSLPLHDDPDDAEYTVCGSSFRSRGEETVAASRTTMQSSSYTTPSATFTFKDMNPSGAVLAVDDTVPDVEGQEQVENEQLWQIIRLQKIHLLQQDVVITPEEMNAWLSPADHTFNQSMGRNIRHEDSDHWFFQHQQFVAWKREPASFLWLQGVPSSGKTVLSSAIIDHLQGDLSSDGSPQNLLYFYFDCIAKKTSLADAIPSLVTQLYYQRPQSQEHLDSLWTSYMKGRELPTTQVLIGTLKMMLQDAGETWLILDALDECRPRYGRVEPDLLTWLQDIHSHHQDLHLVVTSRPLIEIMESIGGFAKPFVLSWPRHRMDNTPAGSLDELVKSDHELKEFENFKATSVKELYPGSRLNARFDDQRAVYRPSPSLILTSKLSQAMLDTEMTANLKYKPQGSSWDDVLDCISIAKATYDGQGKNTKIRAWSRNANEITDSLKSLVSIIPDEQGLSVLRQGLVILFQAWQSHTKRKNREKILRLLDDLPEILANATEIWKLFSRDERLRIAVLDLYETVLDSISVLIQILLRAQDSSFIAKAFHLISTNESQRIDDTVNTVMRAKAVVETRVHHLVLERVARLDDISTSSLSERSVSRHTLQKQREIMTRVLGDIPGLQNNARLLDGGDKGRDDQSEQVSYNV